MASECEKCGRPKGRDTFGVCWGDVVCDEMAAADRRGYERGLKEAIEVAQSQAWVSTWDGWYETSPRIDWAKAEAEIARRLTDEDR